MFQTCENLREKFLLWNEFFEKRKLFKLCPEGLKTRTHWLSPNSVLSEQFYDHQSGAVEISRFGLTNAIATRDGVGISLGDASSKNLSGCGFVSDHFLHFSEPLWRKVDDLSSA